MFRVEMMKYIFVVLPSLCYVSRVAAKVCLRNEFQCLNGDCIQSILRCDGYSKCSDSSDEFNCEEYSCPNSTLRCGDSLHCVPRHFTCDGMPDCSDGSDETNCVPDPVCLTNQFQCSSGECVLKMWRCDGRGDCLDSSDESGCETMNQCPAGYFHCGTGSCELPSSVCDGYKNCLDGSDERNCDKCENWGCSHFCTETLLQPQCHCPEGFELDEDKRTCKDINECLEKGICDHDCLNTLGSFSCICHDGYELINKTCGIKGYEGSEFIFYNEGPSVYIKNLTKAGLESTYLLPLSVQLSRIAALSFDFRSGNLFIADADRPAINAVNVHTLRVRELVTERIASPVDIAFDWLSNNLYWIDSVNGSTEVVSVDTLRRTVLIKDLQNPLSLAIAPYSGTMFIAIKSFDSCISMYGMDGKLKRILHSDHGSPLSLALHPSKTLLYWSDPSLGMISYVNYSSSSSPRIVKMGISGIMSLTVSESDVFYTTEEPEVTERVHRLKLAGYDKDIKWKSMTSSFGKKYSGKSECLIENGGCDYLCLTSEFGRSCACSLGMTLDKDGKSCLS